MKLVEYLTNATEAGSFQQIHLDAMTRNINRCKTHRALGNSYDLTKCETAALFLQCVAAESANIGFSQNIMKYAIDSAIYLHF